MLNKPVTKDPRDFSSNTIGHFDFNIQKYNTLEAALNLIAIRRSTINAYIKNFENSPSELHATEMCIPLLEINLATVLTVFKFMEYFSTPVIETAGDCSCFIMENLESLQKQDMLNQFLGICPLQKSIQAQ